MTSLQAAVLIGIALGGGVVIGYVIAKWSEIRKQEHELEFKRNAILPKPLPTQSIDALREVGRPVAHQSRAHIYPRRARKS